MKSHYERREGGREGVGLSLLFRRNLVKIKGCLGTKFLVAAKSDLIGVP